MVDIDLSQYYLGGYFVVGGNTEYWQDLDITYFPDKLISLSECVCSRFSATWGWDGTYKSKAVEFGVNPDKWDEFIKWYQAEIESETIKLWGLFHSVEVAREFVKFLTDTTNIAIVGFGLPKELEFEDWNEDHKNPQIVYTIEPFIAQHLLLNSEGEFLGFDVTSFGYGDIGHSWICHGLHIELAEQFNIHVNENGLIKTHSEAKRAYEWIMEDTKALRSEPYVFWILISYPLTLMADD
jgi:hypothetical protein